MNDILVETPNHRPDDTHLIRMLNECDVRHKVAVLGGEAAASAAGESMIPERKSA